MGTFIAFKALLVAALPFVLTWRLGVDCVMSMDSQSETSASCANQSVMNNHPSNNTDINSTQPLHILLMAPYPDSSFHPSWSGGPAIVPAAMVARKLINNRSDILEGYTIEFLMADSGCNVTTKASNSIVSDVLYSGTESDAKQNVVGIIGPGCSEATLSVASIVTDERMSLVQISPTATSPKLTNTMRYPNTFRPIVSAHGYICFYRELIKIKRYRQVGALYETKRLFQAQIYALFEEALQNDTVPIKSFGLISPQFPAEEFRHKIRIIFVFASTEFAQELLCYAFSQNIVYPNYQFIFSNRNSTMLMKNVTTKLNGRNFSCSENDMAIAVTNVVFANFRLVRKDRDMCTDVGISYNYFRKLYEEALDDHLASNGLTEDDVVDTEHQSNYFDATWALALSLNNSLPRLEEKGLSLSDYRYGMPEITKVIKNEIFNLSFEGMRGKVQFSTETHDGADVTIIDICQVTQDGDCSIVGFFNASAMFSKASIFENATLIRDNFDLKPHISLGILVMIAVGILLAVLFACQIANVIWVEHKSIKASSPNLNHLIFSGCYLALVGAVVYTNMFVFIDVTNDNNRIVIPLHCNAMQWASTMTYSLVFGTICAKQWRIHKIFNTFRSTRIKSISDNVLIAIALFPVAIDIVINVVWNTVDPWKFRFEQGVTISSCETSSGDLVAVWSLCVAIPKGVLTSVVVYLAIATRRVHKKEFKQTKSINVLVYSLVILTGIFLSLFFILQSVSQFHSSWAVALSYVLFSTFDIGFVVLCFVFVLLPPLLPSITEKLLKRTRKSAFSKNY